MRVVVIHYDFPEAQLLCDRIRRAGHEASAYPVRGTKGLRSLSDNPPDVIVIDLVRLPYYGRAMGAMLRERKSTRQIPLVFLTGDPKKTAVTKRLLPDATFADLLQLGPAIEKAVHKAPENPVVPNGYGTPVAQKLRIREESVVALVHAPEGFEEVLGKLPKSARLQTKIVGADVILVFVKSPAALGKELAALKREMRPGLAVWICWPKKSGSLGGGITILGIREMLQALGLTDYKPCSLDKTWSATAVAMRKQKARG